MTNKKQSKHVSLYYMKTEALSIHGAKLQTSLLTLNDCIKLTGKRRLMMQAYERAVTVQAINCMVQRFIKNCQKRYKTLKSKQRLTLSVVGKKSRGEWALIF